MHISFIVEILGRPADFIVEQMSKVIERLENENNVDILDKRIHEPKPREGGLFTTFAEIDARVAGIQEIARIIFNYMPSHIEVIEPQETKLKNFELTDFLNDLIARLHKYDEIAKTLYFENRKLRLLISSTKQQADKEKKEGKKKAARARKKTARAKSKGKSNKRRLKKENGS